VVLANDNHQIENLQSQLLNALETMGYSKASRFAVRLAVQEALANGFNHGHKNLPPQTPLTVEFHATPDDLTISVEDQGPGFKPEAVADCTLDENLEVPRGRGIMLIRAYMTDTSYNDRGNKLTLHYKKPAAAPAPSGA